VFSWLWPWVGLILPLPLLIRRWVPPYRRISMAVKVPFFETLEAATSKPDQVGTSKLVWVAIILWVSLVSAAARPVWFGDPINIATSGRDLMLALDISDSMRIEDMPQQDTYITRIQAIKAVGTEFINARVGDRIGLILFGQRSYLMSPLTFDRRSVAEQLNEALPGFAGSSTAIGDAIGKAIELLRDRPASSRVLILMTDGSNTHGSEPVEAMQIATEAGIRIHTIGVGGTRKRTVFADGRQMEIDPTRDLDEATLISIAQITGGQYFRARDPEQMSAIYAHINALEPTPDEKWLRPQRSLFHWPLALALVMAGILLIPANRLPTHE